MSDRRTMQPFFTAKGEAALAQAMQRRPLLAFDFDGTLTPIVARPADARLAAGVAARLSSLAAHLPVAIITGRSVVDVRDRLGFEPRYIVGNHGAEGVAIGTEGAAGEAMHRLRERVQVFAPALEAAGVSVEDKQHSIALHYRMSRTRERALEAIANLLAEREPALRVFGGKLVVNVVPRASPDKADAVRALLLRCGAPCAVFAGDDVNDEPVFASAPLDWLTIRVGRDDPRSQAQFVLDSPAEMALLLARMLAFLERPGPLSG